MEGQNRLFFERGFFGLDVKCSARCEAANECCPAVGGTERVLGSSPWEGEAPAEPDVSFQ